MWVPAAEATHGTSDPDSALHGGSTCARAWSCLPHRSSHCAPARLCTVARPQACSFTTLRQSAPGLPLAGVGSRLIAWSKSSLSGKNESSRPEQNSGKGTTSHRGFQLEKQHSKDPMTFSYTFLQKYLPWFWLSLYQIRTSTYSKLAPHQHQLFQTMIMVSLRRSYAVSKQFVLSLVISCLTNGQFRCVLFTF